MNKRYAVYGGYVISINDSDEHYVGPYRVAALYGVNQLECVFRFTGEPHEEASDLIVLQPDPTGAYQLPNARPPCQDV